MISFRNTSHFNKNYQAIFNHVPIALLIEDFSKAAEYAKKIIATSSEPLEDFFKKNPIELQKIAGLIEIKEVNKKALNLYKATNKEQLKGNIKKIFTPKSVEGFASLVTSVLLKKNQPAIKSVNKNLEGKEISILIDYYIIEGDENKLEKVVVSIEDISNQIETSEKLISTQSLLSNTLNSIKDGLVILDENSKYMFVNPKAEHYLGKKSSELLGKILWDEFPEKEGDLFYDNYYKSIQTNTSISFENFYKFWNSWFENRIIPFKSGVLIFFNEISKQKEKEERIKEAYNIINKSASVAFLLEAKKDFPVVFASKNTEKLFGYTYQEFLQNTVKIFEIVHPEDLELIQPKFFSLVKDNKITHFEPNPVRIITKKGEIKWVEANFDTVKNAKDEVTHIQGIAHDITERIVAEQKLYENSQQLQYQFNNTPLASIIWDTNFKVLEWNNAATKIFGYTEQEAKDIRKKFFLTPPNVLPIKEEEILYKFWNELHGFRNTNENITKNGSIILCNWYNVAIRNAEGSIIAFASFVDDITERTKAKELLEISEKKYRNIFEKSMDAVLILKEGLFVDCNLAALKIFGYEQKEGFLNVHPSKLSPEVQPNGASSFDLAEEMIACAIKQGSHRFKWYHKRKNGQVFPVEVSLTAIEDNNKISTIYSTLKDITEQVKKEDLEGVLFNISSAALTISDFNEFSFFIRSELQKVIETNNFYIALYDEKTDMISTPVFVDEKEEVEDFPAGKTLTGYVIKTKKSLIINSEEHQKLIKTGVVNLVGEPAEKWVGVPLKINEKVIGAIVVQSYENEYAYTTDDVNLLEFVSEQISAIILRKKNEKDLQIALEKAQESDKLKSSFLANMSHEIRTPMNGIIGFSELLMQPNLNENQRVEYAKVVIKSSQRLLSIVNDILDISKIESGAVHLKNEDVNLNLLLEELEQFFKPKAQEKQLQFLVNKTLKSSNCNVQLDKQKLHQVLTNLLSNSFKYTNSGSVELGYVLKDKELEFYVKDTGIGIDKKMEETIFDRFVQEENQFNISNKGTGLGLAISKKLVELWNGKIWLDSSENGTAIYFTTPYKLAKPKEIISVINTNNWKYTMKNLKIAILFVEDEEFNMMYISELFSNSAITILEATNGKQAIEIAASHPEIKMVFMDLKMPVLDGKSAMLAIKKNKPKLPIIALSAFAMETDKERALKEGFDDYLTKPIEKEKLLAIINRFK